MPEAPRPYVVGPSQPPIQEFENPSAQRISDLAAEAEKALEALRVVMHVCKLFGARPLREIDCNRLFSLLEPVIDFVEEAYGQAENEETP